MKTIISHTPTETSDLASDLAGSLKGGEIITLSGDLGAGKTTFSQALAAALGVPDLVNSPTFAIMKVHEIVDLSRPGLKNFLHVDAYRLRSWSEFLSLGVEDYLAQDDTITVIEWPSQIDYPPEKASVQISIRALSENEREFTIEKNAL